MSNVPNKFRKGDGILCLPDGLLPTVSRLIDCLSAVVHAHLQDIVDSSAAHLVSQMEFSAQADLDHSRMTHLNPDSLLIGS